MAVVKKESTRDIIKNALAGRTQRWLALQIGLSDTQFSNKILGITEFTQKEKEAINKILNTNI